jgi:hypothetical protein
MSAFIAVDLLMKRSPSGNIAMRAMKRAQERGRTLGLSSLQH